MLIAGGVLSCATQGSCHRDPTGGASALDAQAQKNTANRLCPKINLPATALEVVDLGHDQIDGQVCACGLQGIVNRDHSTKIYVMNTRCRDNHGGWHNQPAAGSQAQMGQFWLREIFSSLPQEPLPLDLTERNPGFRALLEHHKSSVKGMIIYDPALEPATIEAATTIAGQTDGLIVSPQLAEELRSYSLPVIADLRGKFTNNIECVDWLKANYFKTANRQIAFTWSHMTTDWTNSWGGANKDYVVANRLFTFFLDIGVKKECDYYENIIKDYPPGTPIMGWTDELKADKLFADYGYFMLPCISVENLTVLSSYPSANGGWQPAPKAYPVASNAVYIAFLVSDGDNLLHSLIYEPYTIYNSTNYGQVPITWIINPAIIDLAPPVFQWYGRHLRNQEYGAMMGDGSPIADRFSGFSFYCDYTRQYLERAGISTMKQMVDGEPVCWRVQPYAMNSGYSGAPDWRGVGPFEYHLDNRTFHLGTVNDAHLMEVLDSAPTQQPVFLTVFCGGASRDVPTEVREMAGRVNARHDGKKYDFVRCMDLAATYREWKGLPLQ